jgi:hypothetical protein
LLDESLKMALLVEATLHLELAPLGVEREPETMAQRALLV